VSTGYAGLATGERFHLNIFNFHFSVLSKQYYTKSKSPSQVLN